MSSELQSILSKPLETAVLFLVFNRLDTTKKVFQAIRKAKPPRLFIAADGARIEKKGEVGKVKVIREYILNNIDWDCEVKTLFREENLGCKHAVSSAITWFFEHEEQGIILEDDCLPSQSFFWYCQYYLNFFKNDYQVLSISGSLREITCIDNSSLIFESSYFNMWGWATWKRSWENYDVNFFNKYRFEDVNFKLLNKDKSVLIFWKRIFNLMKNNKINTWDYQFFFYSFLVDGRHIYPATNMIHNIGFGFDATHTFNLTSPVARNLAKDYNFIDHRIEKQSIQSIDYLLEHEYSARMSVFKYAKYLLRMLLIKIGRI